jgi:hypothetical protein
MQHHNELRQMARPFSPEGRGAQKFGRPFSLPNLLLRVCFGDCEPTIRASGNVSKQRRVSMG